MAEAIVEAAKKDCHRVPVDERTFFREGQKGIFLRFVYPGECQDDPQTYIVKAQAEHDGASR